MLFCLFYSETFSNNSALVSTVILHLAIPILQLYYCVIISHFISLCYFSPCSPANFSSSPYSTFSHIASIMQLRRVVEHAAIRKPCKEHHQQTYSEWRLERETDPRTPRRNHPSPCPAGGAHCKSFVSVVPPCDLPHMPTLMVDTCKAIRPTNEPIWSPVSADLLCLLRRSVRCKLGYVDGILQEFGTADCTQLKYFAL